MNDDEFDRNREGTQTESRRHQSKSDGGQTKLEALLGVLTSWRRRYAIYYLQDHKVTDLDSLAMYLASIEQDVSASALNKDDITRMRTQLVHMDLPALVDAQLFEFDRRSKAIRYSEPSSLLNGLIRLCAEIDAPDDRPG